MKRFRVAMLLASLVLMISVVSPHPISAAAVPVASSGPQNLRSASASNAPQQAMGPTVLALTSDGHFAYVGFHLSETVAKVHLPDLTIQAVADLHQFFPLQSYRATLDASGGKLFVHSTSWRNLIVLDTQTMQVIHTIDDIDASGMFLGHDGRLLIWSGNNKVKRIDTGTYAVSEFTDPSIGFLQIQESPSDASHWYVVTSSPGGPWVIGLYDTTTKSWLHQVEIPQEGTTPGIWDFKVLPDESKLYAGAMGGRYTTEYHDYGWLYGINLQNWHVTPLPIDGGAACLEVSPDSKHVYIGTDMPKPIDTGNLVVVDTQTDTISNTLSLGRTRYQWAFAAIADLQIDPANPDLLYGISNDANSIFKINVSGPSLSGVAIFNRQDLSPHFFARRPGQETGYVLAKHIPFGFDFDLEAASVDGLTGFPSIRSDSGSYDVAVTDSGNLYIAQGENVLEVDGADRHLIASHPLPPGVPSIWNFILSRDQSKLYSITADPVTQRPSIFTAIDTADFHTVANFSLTGGAFDTRPFELPDGSKLYAVGGEDFGAITIPVIETDHFTNAKTITYDDAKLRGISGGPYTPYAYDANTHTLFVGATFVVLAIDTQNDTIKEVIHLEDVATAIGLKPEQFIYVNAVGLVYQPQENFLYIVHFDRSFVSIYDLNKHQFLPQAIPLKGFLPVHAFANQDASKIFVIGTRSDTVSVIDVASKSVEKVIDLQASFQQSFLPVVIR
jgi:YVTN family beta-propeller protein